MERSHHKASARPPVSPSPSTSTSNPSSSLLSFLCQRKVSVLVLFVVVVLAVFAISFYWQWNLTHFKHIARAAQDTNKNTNSNRDVEDRTHHHAHQHHTTDAVFIPILKESILSKLGEVTPKQKPKEEENGEVSMDADADDDNDNEKEDSDTPPVDDKIKNSVVVPPDQHPHAHEHKEKEEPTHQHDETTFNQKINEFTQRIPRFPPPCVTPKALPSVSDYVGGLFDDCGFRPPVRTSPGRIIDAFLFNHEFDILILRLQELKHVVQHFLLVEADFTFQNTSKPLYFQRWIQGGSLDHQHPHTHNRTKEQKDEIIRMLASGQLLHVIVDDWSYAERKKFVEWEGESYHRSSIGRLGFPAVEKELRSRNQIGIQRDDVLIFGDIDEIPNYQLLDWVSTHANNFYYTKPGGVPASSYFPPYIVVQVRWTYYNYNWDNLKTWGGPHIMTFGAIFQEGRMNNMTVAVRFDGFGLRDRSQANCKLNPKDSDEFVLGWHCSWCFSEEEMIIKSKSTPHKDFNTPEFTSLDLMKKARKEGFWFRSGEKGRYHPNLKIGIDAPTHACKYYWNFPYMFHSGDAQN